jgi:mannose-6-phosphate isomerase-like protein (cupin superfamily)
MHASKNVLPSEALGETYEARVAEWGEYTAYFERIAAGTDYGAYYETCDCPHFGYIFKGKVRFVYKDGREEVVSAGEMYYIPAGHTFQVLEDTETVEFSPTAEYRQHMEKVAKNMAATPRREG